MVVSENWVLPQNSNFQSIVFLGIYWVTKTIWACLNMGYPEHQGFFARLVWRSSQSASYLRFGVSGGVSPGETQ